MAFGVFVHRPDTSYDDRPSERYQFPRSYLSRAVACTGDWIVYYEPRKVPDTRGYFAVAKVERIVEDPTAPEMHLALIEPGSYLDFAEPVPFSTDGAWPEAGVLNGSGKISGRAQAAVRPLSPADFRRIVERGLVEPRPLMERVDGSATDAAGGDSVVFGRDRVTFSATRIVRDRAFRKVVLRAYGERCAMSGLKLINGGGRAEVEAAHVRPVEADGPDVVSNGIALCGTAHWMFDRGLLGLDDDLGILVSRQANDPDAIQSFLNRDLRLLFPVRASDRPHPHYLKWHRENVFKS